MVYIGNINRYYKMINGMIFMMFVEVVKEL